MFFITIYQYTITLWIVGMEINEFHAGLFDPSNQCDCFKAARCDSFIITFMLKGASCFGSSFVALSACHTM